MEPTVPSTSLATSPFELTDQQVAFFQAFGFLALPGLFADDIERITAGFEEVFEDPTDLLALDEDNSYHHTDDPDYRDRPRVIVPGFIDRSADLAWLHDDPRLAAVAAALLGDGYEYAQSDGNLFNCDVYWHMDVFGAPVGHDHLKCYFYLDHLTADSGALRVLPGTNHLEGEYAALLRTNLEPPSKIREIYGVELDELPSWCLEVTPGDLVVGNFRTFHASFGGRPRRRLFTINYRARRDEP